VLIFASVWWKEGFRPSILIAAWIAFSALSEKRET
jgi:hypothetical protein